MEAPFEPMEAKLVEDLPAGTGWQFEPKWDGFRCLAVKQGHDVELFAKSGKPLGRYFPDVAAAVAGLPQTDFVLDGELLIPVEGVLSFDALQMRLHPAASRVKKLAAEYPALLVLFDLPVAPGGKTLASQALAQRRKTLEAFFTEVPHATLRLSPVTDDRRRAATWLDHSGALDGVVAKALDSPYVAGERQMLKVKRIRTADCVVGGFRYGTGSRLVGSLLLGLYDEDGRLDHVGFTSMIANHEKPELTARLEALRGGPGFTGRSPGGPSRWSTERTREYEALRHELAVEVGFDQVTGGRIRHGARLLRWRPDKAPRQCTMEQIAPAAAVAGPVAEILRSA